MNAAETFLAEAQHNNELMHDALLNEAKRRRAVAEQLVKDETLGADPVEVMQMLRDAIRLDELAEQVRKTIQAAEEIVEAEILDADDDEPICDVCDHSEGMHVLPETDVEVIGCTSCIRCVEATEGV